MARMHGGWREDKIRGRWMRLYSGDDRLVTPPPSSSCRFFIHHNSNSSPHHFSRLSVTLAFCAVSATHVGTAAAAGCGQHERAVSAIRHHAVRVHCHDKGDLLAGRAHLPPVSGAGVHGPAAGCSGARIIRSKSRCCERATACGSLSWLLRSLRLQNGLGSRTDCSSFHR